MDRNTIIGFVLIGVLLMAYFAINSNEQKKYQGTPATAVYDFVKAMKQGDSAAVANALHPNAASTDVLKSIYKDTSLRKTFLNIDSASIKMDPPIEDNGRTKVRIYTDAAQPIEFMVALSPESKYKVVSDDKLLLNLLQYRAKDTALLSAEALSNYKKYVASLTPQKIIPQSSGFNLVAQKETFAVLENDVIRVELSSRGGQPKAVYLKKFKTYNDSVVRLNASEYNQLNYQFTGNQSKGVNIHDINFVASPMVENADHSRTITMLATDTMGNKIAHKYTLGASDYMLDLNIDITGAGNLFAGKEIEMTWNVETPKIEKDSKYELTQQHFCHYSDDSYDFNYCQSNDHVELTNTDWVAVKQQFFLSALVAKNKFTKVNTSWAVAQDPKSDYLAQTTCSVKIPVNLSANINIPLQMYFGPSDYNVLKKYNNHMQSIVPYGSGPFAFVKYINRHFLLPVFDWLKGHIANMGIIILLITLLIRLITSPILYKSYVSGAKMKALKPEVDALRAKYKDDQQAFGMEQMKLWKSAGVSPLGGCIPALLQIPIFMSLYFFFQSNIGLRGQSFLWSHDLSQYDSIANLPFSIPLYGDHVSLFTITAVVTSLLISLYGMSNMQDNGNPFMKYLPFIFPILLLGVFNKLPAALTWYYTISNTITLLMQIVIQKYIINHEKILAQINENRKKPVKKSKMQERIEAMQESQRKLQEMKKKGNS